MSLYLSQEQFDELAVRLTLEAKRQSDLQFIEQEKQIRVWHESANEAWERLELIGNLLKDSHPKIYESLKDKFKRRST